ncbi:CocE/NonD family hydrolase [Aureivirga marina]|uniref:CocE/NonD family hydrolase n=1 Tax=Aureivirga marina TaxID=1182451 RepID=UPI0018CACC98|nr:CocE/NonD family hydrolase [Aureivirga marina]
MKFNTITAVLFSIGLIFSSCEQKKEATTEVKKEKKEENYVKKHYDKKEVKIEMRDGKKLFTTIYSPKDKSQKYPIIMQRTPYSCQPYGEDKFRSIIGPSETMMKEGYIVVYQDVRGRWMSEDVYDNMRGVIPNKTEKQIDETTDTYDTIDWLVKNVENNNGNVGTWGISYPGHYATMSVVDAHPALKAASPQACIGDFWFDDFHHNGAYTLSYYKVNSLFGTPKDQPVDTAWYKFLDFGTKDQYQYFLDNTPLSKLDKNYENDFFWKQITEHPNYDEFWQKRGLIQHLKDVKPTVATMVVGGWFDAEDLYGPLETYKNIEKYNKDNYNTMVFGPWSHGDWAREKGKSLVGNVYFGDSISTFYQKNIESKFFHHFLKEDGSKESGLPEAYVFDTGKKEWKQYDVWPPKNAKKQTWFLQNDQKFGTTKASKEKISFVSDPKKPVPYSEDIKTVFTPRKYMTDDQRFAARRPDVLVFETEVLDNEVTLAGDILAKLNVATTGTDADWIVKVIDVYPANHEEHKDVQDHLKMSNYHQMVRSEIMRGKFRNDFSKPEAFTPNKETEVAIKLQDVFHTFKKGHKIQVQIQSSWFPLFDLNPQTFVPNIYKAKEEDFKKQTHSVFTNSTIEFTVLEK